MRLLVCKFRGTLVFNDCIRFRRLCEPAGSGTRRMSTGSDWMLISPGYAESHPAPPQSDPLGALIRVARSLRLRCPFYISSKRLAFSGASDVQLLPKFLCTQWLSEKGGVNLLRSQRLLKVKICLTTNKRFTYRSE